MRVDVLECLLTLGLDRKTIGVLRMIGANDTVTMSQFIKTLNVMEFDDWDKLDECIEKLIIFDKKDNTEVTTKEPKVIQNVDPVVVPKKVVVKKPVAKVTKAAKSKEKVSKKLLDKKRSYKKRTTYTYEEIHELIKDYLDSNGSYTIKGIASDLNISYSTVERHIAEIDPMRQLLVTNSTSSIAEQRHKAIEEYINSVEVYRVADIAKRFSIGNSAARRYCKMVDPDGSKIAPNRGNSKGIGAPSKNSILNYIVLSEDDKMRKSWLDAAVTTYSKENHLSKARVMNPIYDTLTKNYGIVFMQEGKDFLYKHSYTPIEDYPLPSNYEILILNDEIFNIAKSIMIDKYKTV